MDPPAHEQAQQEDQEERPERRQRRDPQNGPQELNALLRILARQRVVLERARAATNADLVAALRESGMLTRCVPIVTACVGAGPLLRAGVRTYVQSWYCST